eukprot:8115792-Alexandrium_andersonii.AAC.1
MNEQTSANLPQAHLCLIHQACQLPVASKVYQILDVAEETAQRAVGVDAVPLRIVAPSTDVGGPEILRLLVAVPHQANVPPRWLRNPTQATGTRHAGTPRTPWAANPKLVAEVRGRQR